MSDTQLEDNELELDDGTESDEDGDIEGTGEDEEDGSSDESDESDEDSDESGESDTAEAKAGTSGRIQLPDGIVSPITALNYLKRKGLAAADHPPQRMYGYVKNPGKTDAFPVKHYNAEGKAHDTAQVDDRGHTVTRPGVKIKEVVAWWKRADERAATKAAAKEEAAKKKAAKEQKKTKGEPTDEELDAMLNAPDEDEGEFVDAEEAE